MMKFCPNENKRRLEKSFGNSTYILKKRWEGLFFLRNLRCLLCLCFSFSLNTFLKSNMQSFVMIFLQELRIFPFFDLFFESFVTTEKEGKKHAKIFRRFWGKLTFWNFRFCSNISSNVKYFFFFFFSRISSFDSSSNFSFSFSSSFSAFSIWF